MARVVVVSGGGPGIGLAVARRMNQAGDRVVIVGRREPVLKQAAASLGEQVAAIAADLRDHAAAQRVADTVKERYGQGALRRRHERPVTVSTGGRAE